MFSDTTMADPKPRYEFRTWAQTLAEARAKLQQWAAAAGRDQGRETYLISALTERCNTKIRNGLIDMKRLLATERGLELWKPVLKAAFPIDHATISERIFPALELPAPRLAADDYSMEEFLDQVLAHQVQVAIVKVEKTRQQFTSDGCQAEFTEVLIEGISQQTVAVESEDPVAVLSAMTRLGLENARNTSYIRRIKQILNAQG
jgi:exopolyphosphatase/guanosine-5'-triphosphate,3'-diphosphate pyrophosphatase